MNTDNNIFLNLQTLAESPPSERLIASKKSSGKVACEGPKKSSCWTHYRNGTTSDLAVVFQRIQEMVRDLEEEASGNDLQKIKTRIKAISSEKKGYIHSLVHYFLSLIGISSSTKEIELRKESLINAIDYRDTAIKLNDIKDRYFEPEKERNLETEEDEELESSEQTKQADELLAIKEKLEELQRKYTEQAQIVQGYKRKINEAEDKLNAKLTEKDQLLESSKQKHQQVEKELEDLKINCEAQAKSELSLKDKIQDLENLLREAQKEKLKVIKRTFQEKAAQADKKEARLNHIEAKIDRKVIKQEEVKTTPTPTPTPTRKPWMAFLPTIKPVEKIDSKKLEELEGIKTALKEEIFRSCNDETELKKEIRGFFKGKLSKARDVKKVFEYLIIFLHAKLPDLKSIDKNIADLDQKIEVCLANIKIFWAEIQKPLTDEWMKKSQSVYMKQLDEAELNKSKLIKEKKKLENKKKETDFIKSLLDLVLERAKTTGISIDLEETVSQKNKLDKYSSFLEKAEEELANLDLSSIPILIQILNKKIEKIETKGAQWEPLLKKYVGARDKSVEYNDKTVEYKDQFVEYNDKTVEYKDQFVEYNDKTVEYNDDLICSQKENLFEDVKKLKPALLSSGLEALKTLDEYLIPRDRAFLLIAFLRQYINRKIPFIEIPDPYFNEKNGYKRIKKFFKKIPELCEKMYGFEERLKKHQIELNENAKIESDLPQSIQDLADCQQQLEKLELNFKNFTFNIEDEEIRQKINQSIETVKEEARKSSLFQYQKRQYQEICKSQQNINKLNKQLFENISKLSEIQIVSLYSQLAPSTLQQEKDSQDFVESLKDWQALKERKPFETFNDHADGSFISVLDSMKRALKSSIEVYVQGSKLYVTYQVEEDWKRKRKALENELNKSINVKKSVVDGTVEQKNDKVKTIANVLAKNGLFTARKEAIEREENEKTCERKPQKINKLSTVFLREFEEKFKQLVEKRGESQEEKIDPIEEKSGLQKEEHSSVKEKLNKSKKELRIYSLNVHINQVQRDIALSITSEENEKNRKLAELEKKLQSSPLYNFEKDNLHALLWQMQFEMKFFREQRFDFDSKEKERFISFDQQMQKLTDQLCALRNNKNLNADALGESLLKEGKELINSYLSDVYKEALFREWRKKGESSLKKEIEVTAKKIMDLKKTIQKKQNNRNKADLEKDGLLKEINSLQEKLAQANLKMTLDKKRKDLKTAMINKGVEFGYFETVPNEEDLSGNKTKWKNEQDVASKDHRTNYRKFLELIWESLGGMEEEDPSFAVPTYFTQVVAQIHEYLKSKNASKLPDELQQFIESQTGFESEETAV